MHSRNRPARSLYRVAVASWGQVRASYFRQTLDAAQSVFELACAKADLETGVLLIGRTGRILACREAVLGRDLSGQEQEVFPG